MSSGIASKEWVKALLSKLNIGKYSTDEIRVGTWIDGKPLYQKIVVQPLTKNDQNYSTEVTYNHNIANAEMIFINQKSSFFYNELGTTQLLTYYSLTNSKYFMFVNTIGRKTFSVQTMMDRSAWTAYLTFNYTKTTD